VSPLSSVSLTSGSASHAGLVILGTQKKSEFVLEISLQPCYNTPMKKFTVLNPFSAQSIMDNIPADRLDAMVKYFAWLLAVQPSSLIIKETA